MIAAFSMAFFSEGNNIIWAYAIGGTFILVSLFPLIMVVKKLENLKVKVN
jgi:hypothetical protein